MTLGEMKQKVYSMIEEYNEESDNLTEDEDLATKMNGVINQIQNEVARLKKIPGHKTLQVNEGDEITMKDIEKDIYQLYNIRGVDYETMNDLVIFNESGNAKVYYFKYPTQITEDTSDDFTFDLSTDVLEIMPYGVAGDLLKSDVSSQYGAVYTARYQQLLSELDPRYNMGSVSLSEGINI